MKEKIKLLLQTFPQTYSEELGIDLKSKNPKEIFKWFLASIFFGARIGENIAKNTYRQFIRDNLTTPKKILEAGWNGLVASLDAGGYVRYDFSTADDLLAVMKLLLEKYHGNLNTLYKNAKSQEDMERMLDEFRGVGATTINIFLRELRNIWNVEPLPSRFAILAAKNLSLIKSKNAKEALKDLKEIWKRNKIKNKSFVNFETALLRLGKNYCRKGKCKVCSLQMCCRKT
jgi:endonuclease III